jgi:RNA polymerase sigma-70 factor (ECF subfamily)
MGKDATNSEENPLDRHAGDVEETFRALFHRYYPSLLRFFARRGFSPETCEDLGQETFIRVFRGIGAFRGEARFESWLFKIARNVYLNELRRQDTRKHKATELPLDVLIAAEDAADGPQARMPAALEAPASPEDALVRAQLGELADGLARLPTQMRQCMMLRVGQDLRYREIAEVMGISIEAVKSHLHQAKARLRPLLGGIFSDISRD